MPQPGDQAGGIAVNDYSSPTHAAIATIHTVHLSHAASPALAPDVARRMEVPFLALDLGLDVRILARTPLAVVSARGAF